MKKKSNDTLWQCLNLLLLNNSNAFTSKLKTTYTHTHSKQNKREKNDAIAETSQLKIKFGLYLLLSRVKNLFQERKLYLFHMDFEENDKVHTTFIDLQ